ncbi:unnamed protein product [Sympodiomycopsis kandeliae]
MIPVNTFFLHEKFKARSDEYRLFAKAIIEHCVLRWEMPSFVYTIFVTDDIHCTMGDLADRFDVVMVRDGVIVKEWQGKAGFYTVPKEPADELKAREKKEKEEKAKLKESLQPKIIVPSNTILSARAESCRRREAVLYASTGKWPRNHIYPDAQDLRDLRVRKWLIMMNEILFLRHSEPFDKPSSHHSHHEARRNFLPTREIHKPSRRIPLYRQRRHFADNEELENGQ